MGLLPQPYDDEVIGSVIERACFQMGIPVKRIVQSLFGTTRSCVSFLMGSKLPGLARHTGLDAEELLLNHTMYPYAVAFIPKGEQARLKRKVINLGDNECIGSITRNVSHGVPSRRICRLCLADDLRRHGESYWRRSHLLPGVLTCPKHRIPLLETRTPLKDAVQSWGIVLADNALAQRSKVRASSEATDAIRDLSVAALRSEIKARDDWPQLYSAMAKRSGYAMTGGDIASGRLSADLVQYFGSELLANAGCAIRLSARNPWPGLMVRDSVSQNHAPAKHVFYQAFCTVGGQAPANFGYRKPGKQPVDATIRDRAASQKIDIFLKAHAASTRRFTVREILDEAGIWQAFRHGRDKYPLVQARIAEFRTSNQSARQVGLRPQWRKRLRSRVPAAT